ncbi:unnamed protein product [Protopolystoma xenopodis]|uniref:Uncharacterized protein n=1 Tax=Protopolystoma xenopodis TaxID=117903 RepID=A0A448XKW7_9PLAT|nr:unnamed protein product [Protopolystoma xenopodis]
MRTPEQLQQPPQPFRPNCRDSACVTTFDGHFDSCRRVSSLGNSNLRLRLRVGTKHILILWKSERFEPLTFKGFGKSSVHEPKTRLNGAMICTLFWPVAIRTALLFQPHLPLGSHSNHNSHFWLYACNALFTPSPVGAM